MPQKNPIVCKDPGSVRPSLHLGHLTCPQPQTLLPRPSQQGGTCTWSSTPSCWTCAPGALRVSHCQCPTPCAWEPPKSSSDTCGTPPDPQMAGGHVHPAQQLVQVALPPGQLLCPLDQPMCPDFDVPSVWPSAAVPLLPAMRLPLEHGGMLRAKPLGIAHNQALCVQEPPPSIPNCKPRNASSQNGVCQLGMSQVVASVQHGIHGVQQAPPVRLLLSSLVRIHEQSARKTFWTGQACRYVMSYKYFYII